MAPAAPADPFEATAALTVVEQTSPTGYDPNPWDAGATGAAGQWPAQGGDTGQVSAVQPFRITPLVAVSAVAAVLAVASAFVKVASFEVAGDFANQQSFKLNDFASNLTVGAIIAAVLLVGGSVLGATGRRVGSGVAGGAGLALAGTFGWVIGATGRRVGSGVAGGAGLALAGTFGWVIGQVIAQFDLQEVLLLGGGGSFTLTTTQEVGFWLAVGAAGMGVVAFVLSLSSAGNDGHAPINPAIGVLGALGTLAVVVGPLIPMNGAALGDNFTNDFIPPASLYLRLAVVVLIGVGGLLGFLANRRWGLGMALGAISVGAWQWVTAITESGDIPLGIAGGNPGATDFTPHVVTTIGVVVMLLAIVAGLLAAAQQRTAQRALP